MSGRGGFGSNMPTKLRTKPTSFRLKLDAYTANTIETWAEALELDPADVVAKLVRAGDRSLRIAERERIYSPAQRRQMQPVWDEIDRRMGAG